MLFIYRIQEKIERVLSQDKLLHMLFGFVLYAVVYFIYGIFCSDPIELRAVPLIAPLVIGVVKELCDLSSARSIFNIFDVIATVFGGCMALIMTL